MIKLLGASLILLASTLVGLIMAKRYTDRPAQLRQLRSALSLLETEISYGSRPLIQACQQISKRETGFISELFQKCANNLTQFDGASTYECFSQAINDTWNKTALSKTDKQIMLDLSKTLGISDRQDQLHHLTLASANLQVEETKAREEQMQYEKMYKTIGVLTGLLIIILMY